jgi:hypothetical protein
MLYVLDDKGGLTRHRVPSASHWDLYRNALTNEPRLVAEMYSSILDIVKGGKYLDPNGQYPNSTWLGRDVLSSWIHAADWNRYTGNDDATSSGLFGQIMWTVMFDQSDDWVTTLTPNGNPGREERVYWRKP